MNTKAMLTLTGLAALFGCAASQSGPSALADPVRELRTMYQGDDGQWVDEGVKKYRQSTLDFIKQHRLFSIQIDDEGRIVSYVLSEDAPCSTQSDDEPMTKGKQDDGVRTFRTLVRANDGTWVDEGVKKYDQRTLDVLAHTKFTATQIDGSGRLVAYAPVGYAPGVTPPAEGTDLEYEVLDKNGYVVEWKAAE